MTKTIDIMDIDPYRQIMTPQQYADLRSKLAKRANVRLKALETATSKITGEAYTYGAYRHLAQYVLGVDDKPRWSESKKVDNVNTMRRQIIQIQAFLKAKSSSISGNREIENLRIKTFEQGKWGTIRPDGGRTPITVARNKDFYDFLNSGLLSSKVQSYFTSEQLIEMYEKAMAGGLSSQEITDTIFKAISDYDDHKAPPSIEDLTARLNIKWITENAQNEDIYNP